MACVNVDMNFSQAFEVSHAGSGFNGHVAWMAIGIPSPSVLTGKKIKQSGGRGKIVSPLLQTVTLLTKRDVASPWFRYKIITDRAYLFLCTAFVKL